MTVEELTKEANDFLLKNYGLMLEIPIRINNRYRVTLGAFNLFKSNPIDIEIAGDLIKHGATSTILDTLYHECVHYALFKKGVPYGDGCVEFENELKRLEIGSTRTTMVGKYVKFKCEKCESIAFDSSLRIAKYPNKYLSGCCRADIKVVGEVIYDGTEATE